jgi:hypothetical protein
MPSTYEPIATTTLTSTSISVVFSSIPQTYTDLILVVQAIAVNTTGNEPLFYVNGDTNGNYSYTSVQGNGSSASSLRITNRTNGELGLRSQSTSTTGGYSSVTHFMNYSNTTTYKTILTCSGDAGLAVETGANMWRSTAAITSINCFISAAAIFNVGSTFTLYGIKAA